MTYYKKKKNKNRKHYFIYILLLLVFTISFYLFKTKTSYMVYYMSYPYSYISNIFKSFNNNKILVNENNDLNKRLLNFNVTLEKNKELESEIIILKEELNLKNIYTNYDIINATIINRNVSYYNNLLTIDKGSTSNIKKNMAVVNNDGLIGIIDIVYEKTSIVKLITSNDNQISVGVEGIDNYKHGLITKYENNYLIIEGITNYDKVSINSKVVTTGLGIFPSGILVGYVNSIENDNAMISKILKVSLASDIKNLKYVAVLGNKINE